MKPRQHPSQIGNLEDSSYSNIVSHEQVKAYLRRQVLGRAAEGPGGVAVTHVLFAQPEVGDLDVTVRVEQQVLQLEISAKQTVVSPWAPLHILLYINHL